jgi:hypothetical protein
MPNFDRYIGIDHSGAETPTSGLKGLRVYMADRVSPPMEVQPPPSPRKYWSVPIGPHVRALQSNIPRLCPTSGPRRRQRAPPRPAASECKTSRPCCVETQA